jgi:hypothetical protein
MIYTPADLKTYFATLAATVGCSFVYGNSERILNRQLSNLVYPVLWLETPEVTRSRNGVLSRQFSAAFLCLSDKPVDDYTGQDAAMDAMFEKTELILQTMQADSEAHPSPFVFDMANARSEEKLKWSADDDWGWRTEFELIGAACETADCCE